MTTETTDDFEDDAPKSKSARKRESTALQELGELLATLPKKEFDRAPLSEDLREQIEIAKNIKSHSGKKRQFQYVGKLMRSIDTDEIANFLKDLNTGKKSAARQFKHVEQCRDELIAKGDSAIAVLLENYPQGDRQQLRQLVRSAQKERDQDKPPASSRKLFRYLKTLLEN